MNMTSELGHMSAPTYSLVGMSEAIETSLKRVAKDHAQKLAMEMAKEYSEKMQAFMNELALSAAITLELRSKPNRVSPEVHIHIHTTEVKEGVKP